MDHERTRFEHSQFKSSIVIANDESFNLKNGRNQREKGQSFIMSNQIETKDQEFKADHVSQDSVVEVIEETEFDELYHQIDNVWTEIVEMDDHLDGVSPHNF